ncbi:MAG: hypothetical protein JKY60_02450 [Kordiimonadaceae bacterium]|nr:hypothetical protein [Kordiimonadaceae bacterium]
MQSVTYQVSRIRQLLVCLFFAGFVANSIWSIIETGPEENLGWIILLLFFVAVLGPIIVRLIHLMITGRDALAIDEHGFHFAVWFPRVSWQQVDAVFLVTDKYGHNLCFEVQPETMKSMRLMWVQRLLCRLSVRKGFGNITVATSHYTSDYRGLLDAAVSAYEKAVPDVVSYKGGKRRNH